MHNLGFGVCLRKGKDMPVDCKRGQGGFVTLLVLILLTTLAAAGLQTYVKANAVNRTARREAQSRQAVYLAEGGIEAAKGQLAVNPAWGGGIIQIGISQVQVTVTAISEGKYQVTSTAQAGLAVRKLEVILVNDTGRWTVSGYREVHT